MMDEAKIRATVAELIGQRCERVENPYGSILSIDLGPLGLRSDDPPDAKPHGWRHLTVLSPWRLQTDDYVVSDWNENGAPGGELAKTIQLLHKHSVITARTASPGWDLHLRWSNGMSLVVFSDSTDERKDAWFILGTDGLEVSAAPVMRAPTADPSGARPA